jgi:hypothetical protein
MKRVRLLRAYKHDMPYVVGDKNAILSLPDWVAGWLVGQGSGIYLDGEPQLGPTRAELERQEEVIRAGNLKQVGEESSQSGAEEPEETKRPYGNAPKSAWVRYAAHGDHGRPLITEERAEGMTKADLMSQYGERLL